RTAATLPVAPSRIFAMPRMPLVSTRAGSLRLEPALRILYTSDVVGESPFRIRGRLSQLGQQRSGVRIRPQRLQMIEQHLPVSGIALEHEVDPRPRLAILRLLHLPHLI